MGHSSYVTALHLSNLELFSASADGSIRVTDIRTGNGRTILETGARVLHPASVCRWALSCA
jgi:WD40 repeat protein